MRKAVAFFDFDGTITEQDSMFHFLKFKFGNRSFYQGMIRLFPKLLWHKLGFTSSKEAKEQLLTYFFKGSRLEDLIQIGSEYATTSLPKIIRPKAMEEIMQLKEMGYDLYLVSASVDIWIKAWGESNGFVVLSTQLEVDDNNCITGKILGENVNGEEKVNKIKNAVTLSNYEWIQAYGDTKGDYPMLNLANKKYFKPFR